jgi:CubicO group peptidase (beta-lactamase class C family)
MSTGGLSTTRLGRLHDVMAGYVERGEVPGLVALVARRGHVHVEALGTLALGGDRPVQRDTLFRIASMTKPITAVAALLLIEECRLRLDEPVDRLLPELADRRVLARLDAPLDDTVPAQRPITVRDLLTFRLGHGVVMAPPGTYPIQAAMDALGVSPGAPAPATPPMPDEWLRRLGTLPLLHQPGEQWLYHTGSDVLGVLIARVAGQPFDTFLRERIFAPLGMRDTAFYVPPDAIDRLATSYAGETDTGPLSLYDPAEDGQWSRPPAFPTGGAGLVSTVDDYLAFARLLLDQGRHGGTRLLSRPAVELMTTDQLTPAQRAGAGIILGDNRGWGFGVAVVTRREGLATPGTYGWDGGLGTSWATDPREDLIGILLTQRAFTSPVAPPVVQDFWTLAYQAIDD